MTDTDNALDEGSLAAFDEEFETLKKLVADRCKANDLELKEPDVYYIGATRVKALRVGMRRGRETQWIGLSSIQRIKKFIEVPFERYSFLSDLEAICSYRDGIIEAAVRPISFDTFPATSHPYHRILSGDSRSDGPELERICVSPDREGLPQIEISAASDVFLALCRSNMRRRITLKISDCHVTTHDTALALLNKVAGTILFQLDLLTNVPMVLQRARKPFTRGRRAIDESNAETKLQYPSTQFDAPPLALYWYGRSADGMPLLKFLAFYQVIEFYFPIYSQTEAQRRLKAILKDPKFRADRDADIAKLLATIHVSRAGGFGDERSQLRATLSECTNNEALRDFFESDGERKEFFLAKGKSSPYHKIPLGNQSVDIRNDVADRIYDIRCKIVHTKSDLRDGNLELLLPFTQEAEQLTYDIEVIQYIAQQVLICASAPFNIHG